MCKRNTDHDVPENFRRLLSQFHILYFSPMDPECNTAAEEVSLRMLADLAFSVL